MKKTLAVFAVLCMFVLVFSVAEGRVFDLRTHKNTPVITSVKFDNLPRIGCCSTAQYAYSGIFVGDTVNVSGRKTGVNPFVSIRFPSGKVVRILVRNGYFAKKITFDEEGDYVVNGKFHFKVCYRAIPVSPTLLVKDIIGTELPRNDEYTLTSVNWNDACLAENGKYATARLLIVDKNGNPLPNLKTKKFVTDEYGIAEVPFSSKDVNIYGNIKAAKYDKIVFDNKGNLVYSWRKGVEIGAFFKNGTLYIDAKQLVLYAFPDFPLLFSELKFGKNYIGLYDLYLPAEILKKNGEVYVNVESLMSVLNRKSVSVLGMSVKYYTDRVEIYIIRDNAA